jgi:protein-S-isoprenylcysteine O-methyltransferase Ste14
MARFVGTPPIHPTAFVLSKVAFALCGVFLLAQVFGLDWSVRVVPALRVVAVVMLVAALVAVVPALAQLGASTRVGLPSEGTALTTTGLYAVSRNPMYVALFLACLASSLYVIHPVNAASAVVAIVLHHRITLAEERFLEQRFGQAWRDYASRVRRYV